MAEVHIQTWRDAYRDSLPPAFLAALSVEVRETFWRDELHALAPDRRPWVAESSGEVVGFVSVGAARDEAVQPFTGEVYALYVLPDCWDQGVGRTLLAHAEHDLNAHGYDDAVLWVLAENQRARTFYEMAGWHADGAIKHDSIGGREISEVRYRLALETSTVAEFA
jgi:ribosomal protein S18 acetylase RimI-like enzyme